MKITPESLSNQPNLLPSSKDLQDLLRENCKTAALKLGLELLEQEVRSLCGDPFSRKTEGQFRRGGSEMTSMLVDGGKISLKRPRVRSAEGEVPLEVLGKLRDQDLLDEHMREAMIDGLSSRNYSKVIKGFSERTGISKSSVSRAFLRASQKDLDRLNHADLSTHRFVGIMIDGSEYASRAIIGAIGITDQCEKIPLGIREGDTENAEIVKDLLSSIIERKFTFAGDRILAVIDGGKALKKGLQDVWGDRVLIQRCWIHKLRNLKNYAPEKYHGQIGWRMKKLMNLVSIADAKRELASFIDWLDGIAYEAGQSLREVGDDLLTVIELKVPRELRKNLSCTNAMESLFGVCRSRTRKVKNWKYHPRLKKKIPRDKILRWVASAIIEHRPKLRKLKGYKQVHLLIAALTEKKIEFIRKEA